MLFASIRRFILCGLCCCLVSKVACAQGWVWARSPSCGSVNGGSEGWLVKTDASDNVYLAGYYYGGNICFGGYTFYNPVNSANNIQALIIKYDSSGNVKWAKASAGGQSRPIGIATDYSGNLFVFGFFTTYSITFDTHTLYNPVFDTANPLENNCYFLLKYNAAGDLMWAKNGSGKINPVGDVLHPGGVAADAGGNVYISAIYNTPTFTIGKDTLFNAGNTGTNDFFIAKYDTAGNPTWAKSFGGISDDYISDIAISNNNNIGLTGYYHSGLIKFGATRLYTSNENAFIAVLDTAGAVLWAHSSESKGNAKAIAFDKTNSVYIAGGFTSSIAFINYSFSNNNGGYYLMKFDSAGNETGGMGIYFTIPAATCCQAYGLTTDACDNVWISANMDKFAGLMLGNGTTINAPSGSSDPIFIAGYTANGSLMGNATLKSGAGNNTGLSNTGLSADSKGRVYLCGDYHAIDPFVVGNDSLHIRNNASATIFVAKYNTASSCDSIIIPPPVYPAVPIITIIPNPAAYECTLDYNGSLGTGEANVAIRDVTGKLINTYSITGRQTHIPLGGLPAGVYICMVKVGSHPVYTICLAVVK